MSEKQKPIRVVVVEDNLADREIIQEFFVAPSGRQLEFSFFEDGEAAHDYLDHNTGDIVILDINLPKISGFEILKKIKSGEKRGSIVVILTSSPNPEEIEKAYNLDVNSYIIKPIEFNAFKDKLKVMANYLIDIIEKPK
ncbi:MAG: response regulator [Flavobacteriales bacterium]|nr:response regulator [Flavobacteriales bacterium]